MGEGRPILPLRDRDPSAIGDWRLQGRIGAGGMGVVYLARRDDGTVGALKVIADHLLDTPGFHERFAREIAILRRVAGAGVARVLDADAAADHPYVVTEFVDAVTLQEWVASNGPMPKALWVKLATGLLSALEAIHAIGVLHRDIKPSNVLLAPNGPVLIDFGVAAVVDTTAITAPQMLIGTPEWLAPERLSGAPASAASDVFSLGGLLAYAGTGRAPFAADSPAESIKRVTSGMADLAGLTADQAALVSRMLAPDPALRPSPAQAVAVLAQSAWSTEPATPATQVQPVAPGATQVDPMPPIPPDTTVRLGVPPDGAQQEPARSRRRPGVIVAIVLIVAGLAIAAGAFLATRDSPSDQVATPTPTPTPETGEFTTSCQWTQLDRLAGTGDLASLVAQCDDNADIRADLGLQLNSAGFYGLNGSIGVSQLAMSSRDGVDWEGTLDGVPVSLLVGKADDRSAAVLPGSTVGTSTVRCSGPAPTVNERADSFEDALVWDNPSTVRGTYSGARFTGSEVGALCSLVVVGVPVGGGLGTFAP